MEDDHLSINDEDTRMHDASEFIPSSSSSSQDIPFTDEDSPSNIELSNEKEESSPGGTRYWVPVVDVKPFIGQEYKSFDLIWEDYRKYATSSEFEPKIGGYYTLAKGGINKHLYYNKEGHKQKKKSDESKTVYSDEHSLTDTNENSSNNNDENNSGTRNRAS